jgi:hypothetical protein
MLNNGGNRANDHRSIKRRKLFKYLITFFYLLWNASSFKRKQTARWFVTRTLLNVPLLEMEWCINVNGVVVTISCHRSRWFLRYCSYVFIRELVFYKSFGDSGLSHHSISNNGTFNSVLVFITYTNQID